MIVYAQSTAGSPSNAWDDRRGPLTSQPGRLCTCRKSDHEGRSRAARSLGPGYRRRRSRPPRCLPSRRSRGSSSPGAPLGVRARPATRRCWLWSPWTYRLAPRAGDVTPLPSCGPRPTAGSSASGKCIVNDELCRRTIPVGPMHYMRGLTMDAASFPPLETHRAGSTRPDVSLQGNAEPWGSPSTYAGTSTTVPMSQARPQFRYVIG
jgi:hypothetical protein